jgi:hypothetical protein
MSDPRSFTALSVWAGAVVTEKPSAKVAPRRRIARVMEQPFMGRSFSSFDRNLRESERIFERPHSVRAGVPRPASHARCNRMRRPRCGPAAISERSGTAVKGLTLVPHKVKTECRGIGRCADITRARAQADAENVP